MIKLLTYPDIYPQQWQAFIDRSPYATWFQTKEAYEFYASNSEEMTPFAVGVVASPKSSPKGKDFYEPTPNPFLKEGEHASFAKTWGAHTADSTQYDLLKENAVNNRKNPTEAESVLWDMLKGNKLGAHFRRQHIILDYIVDFICLDKGLIIELDGGYHNDPRQKEYDEARTAHLYRLGYTELRFKNEELLCNPDAVIQKIKDTLKSLPSINSLPFREGVGVGSTLPSLQGRAGDRLVGVIVGYITRERNAIKQFFTRRAIIIGGPLLNEHISDEALSALLSAVKNQPILNPSLKGRTLDTTKQSPFPSGEGRGEAYTPLPSGRAGVGLPIYIETRNFHDYSKWKSVFEANGFAYQPHYDIQVTCDETHTLSEQRRRQMKKAISNGATICEAQSEQEIRDWYRILNQLYREKVRTPLFTEEFFLRFYRNGVGKYLLVKHQGKVIGGMMCPILNDNAIYEWYVCGLDEDYREMYPSVVATYAAIEYAKQNGLPLFDFMGAGKPDIPYGVRDFKMEFGGELVEYGRFLCIRKPLLYWIGKLGVKWIKRFAYNCKIREFNGVRNCKIREFDGVKIAK